MAWVKLDDAMPHHPKIVAAGPQAFALDVAAICYSNRFATDGFIAESALKTILPGTRNAPKLAAKLVDVGRWKRVEGGWIVHDIGDYQPSAADQKELSRKRAAAGRKGGKRSRPGEANTEANASSEPPEPPPKQEASASNGLQPRPVPSRPDQEVLLPSVVEPSSVPAERQRDPFVDVASAAFDLPAEGQDGRLMGMIAARARKDGHGPDEIVRRVAMHLATFSWPATPGSVHKRWNQLGSKVVTATASQRKLMASELDRMRRNEAIDRVMGDDG